MMTDKPDIKLCYFGGSGGFILLHLLLLSDEYSCGFATNLSIRDIIKNQWNIHDPRLWKSKEHLPANDRTLILKTNLKKIYFFCNPNLEDVSKFEGSTIFLYTDLRSQAFLARYKHAYVLGNHSTSLHKNYVSYYRAQLKKWISHYENIKDSNWPRCFGPRGFQRLPNRIREELLVNPYTSVYLDIPRFGAVDEQTVDQKMSEQEINLRMTDLLSSEFRILPDGTKVLPQVFDFFSFADLTIKLQDMINDLHILSKVTGMPVNHSQEKLRSHWISLHPPELLQEIGINLP